jgi:hypothetical protein
VGRLRGLSATNDDAHEDDVPIPGGRERVEFCVDSVPGSLNRADATGVVAKAVDDSRSEQPDIWVGIFETEPIVTAGCPIEPIPYSPEEATSLEHGVDQVSDPLLFVFVQSPETGVPGGYQSVPYEMYPAIGNAVEATSILFVSQQTAEDPDQMQAAMASALGLNYVPGPPPDPDATK